MRDAYLRYLNIAVERYIIQHAAGKQALGKAQRHVALRVDDLRADFFQYRALIFADRFGDDIGHAQTYDIERGEDAGVDFFTDTYDDGVAVLNAGFLQRLAAQIVRDKCVFGVLAQLAHLCLAAVDDHYVFASGSQAFGQRRAEASQPDDAVGRGILMLDKHPMTLDYTTKKIVTIASVLMFSPEVLVLDEPTGGLDEVGRRMLTKIIRMMHDNGHTVVVISHDMDYVAENSSRIIMMAQGEILDDTSPDRAFLNAGMLKRAQVEPPQITQLDLALQGGKAQSAALSVEDFVRKYKS